MSGLLERYISHHLNIWIDQGARKIFDAGCGYGTWGYKLMTEHPHENLHIEGADLYMEGMAYAQELGKAYKGIHRTDLSRDSLPFSYQEFDIALCQGVLAHLEKAQGHDLIYELRRVSKHMIFSAPTSLFQHTNLLNNPHIEPLQHKSSWSPKDFWRHGMKVRGFDIRGRHEKITYLDAFFSPWTFRLPWLAGALVAFN